MKKQKLYIAYIFLIIFAIVYLTIAQIAEAENKPVERQEKMNRLLDILSTKRPSIPVPKEIYAEKDISKRKQYFEERSRKFQTIEENYEKARNELAAMGDEVIDQLLEIYQDGKLETHIVLVLKKIGTPKAKISLLNIALEQDNKVFVPRALAARNYIKLTKNRDDIKKLLTSRDADVLSITLQNLRGVAIDKELLKRLDELLQSKQYHPVLNFSLRSKVAAIIAVDTGSGLIQEKVSAIVKSLETVEQMPKYNERFQYDFIGTFADVTYSSLAASLGYMKGINTYLSQATNRLTGNPKRWILAVRANRGDSSVKSKVRYFLENPNMLERTLLRSYAIKGYGKIGTIDDLPFLRKLTETDPTELLINTVNHRCIEMIDDKPINNDGERAAIRNEFDKSWEKAILRYPIRKAAQRAVKVIEKKR